MKRDQKRLLQSRVPPSQTTRLYTASTTAASLNENNDELWLVKDPARRVGKKVLQIPRGGKNWL